MIQSAEWLAFIFMHFFFILTLLLPCAEQTVLKNIFQLNLDSDKSLISALV